MKAAILDWIKSKAAWISSDSFISYNRRYELEDLQDDSLVTKYLLLNNTGPPRPSIVTITANVTLTPLTVAYIGTAFTDYVLRNTGTDLIDKNTNVDYDFSTFTIRGDESASVPGTFADSFTFAIKP